MNEVSCRVFGMVFDGLTRREIPHERLVEGLPVTLEMLRGFRKRVDWDVFVQLNERLEELCGGPEDLFQLGHDQLRESSSFAFMRPVARVFRRPRDLYWMGTVWFGRSLFSILEDEFEDLPDKRIREVIRIPAGYRDCPQLFHILHGVLTATPQLLRYMDAQVEMELTPRQATYEITPPARERFARRTIASLTSRYAAWGLVGAMSDQQDELKESYQELSAAREQIAAQAEQLQLIHAIGRELSEHVELDAFTRTVAEVFEKHLPDRRIALWLQPLGAETEALLHKGAGMSGPPARSHPLLTGKGTVGRLEVWGGESDSDARRDELLEGLIPWIALALDNARSHAALQAAGVEPPR
ncbi:MAG: hypothetical protein OEM05_12965 [Myxococcales bacterium]|nr:hypothetical protein [Myxococcales bacterium]